MRYRSVLSDTQHRGVRTTEPPSAAMLYCHLVLGADLSEALVEFIARHLTELLADAFVLPHQHITIRIDSAPPSRYFIGGRLYDRLPPCLVTVHHSSCTPCGHELDALRITMLRFLRETFGHPTFDSQIRFVPTAPVCATMTIASSP